METHVFNMGRKSPFSFLKDSFSSFLNPQTFCKTWYSASLQFIYVRKSFFKISTYNFFDLLFRNKKSIRLLMLSLEFSFLNSRKEVKINKNNIEARTFIHSTYWPREYIVNIIWKLEYWRIKNLFSRIREGYRVKAGLLIYNQV